MRATLAAACLFATCALPPGCHCTDPGADLAIVGDSARIRLEDPYPAVTPWLVDGKVELVAARGEYLGIAVLHRAPGPTTLTFANNRIQVTAQDVESFRVTRPSTDLYGGGRTGTFPDALTPAGASTTNPAYFDIMATTDMEPGMYPGELTIGDRTLPVELTVLDLKLPRTEPRVWAYEDPRELAWAAGAKPDIAAPAAPSEDERRCATSFAVSGVALTPDLKAVDWLEERKGEVFPLRDLPVVIPTDPAQAGDAVRAWIAAAQSTHLGLVPFAIPIDEPATPEARANVIALAKAVRAAGGGPTTFRFAVTDDPRPEYGDLVDLYISLHTPRSANGTQWTYNGAPPRAGSMVLDAQTPGTRTWGWIAYRWRIPVWYVWDALYWHDRYNRNGAPLPGRALDPSRDPTSFDQGEDHGNLDGVLALPGPHRCRRTLRLVALRRGQQDRQLLDLAEKCDPAATAALAAKMVPTALGDAPETGAPSWPTDETAWELARRELLRLAACHH